MSSGPRIDLWLELIAGYRQPDTWQTGDLWRLEGVPWPSVPREGDSIEVGRDDEGEGVTQLVHRVFWRDDGTVDVHLGRLFTCDTSLAEFEVMLTNEGWHMKDAEVRP